MKIWRLPTINGNKSYKNRIILNSGKLQCTVKPAYAVTSIKQPPAFKGHLFLVLS